MEEIKSRIREKMQDGSASVDEQLNFLDEMLEKAQSFTDEEARKKGVPSAPIDPADFTMCDGCQ